MTQLAARPWVAPQSEAFVQALARYTATSSLDTLEEELEGLVDENSSVHDRRCINLNPASNVMNPKAEALLSRGLGTRPSLGYPAQKYEMGLEAIERIEVIAAELAAEVFQARFVEYRAPSGAIANLSAFMALARPGDVIVSPPSTIGGHVSHHDYGAAGRYGLRVVTAPVDAIGYTVDCEALHTLVRKLRPRVITIGGSLNLFAHPVRELRAIADEVGAYLVFDAAHLAGLIAGGAWPNPLEEGAHVMTMSTYKSLGGPPGSLILTNDAEIAQRIDTAVFPGLTANFDVAKTAALAIALLDWKAHGEAYAQAMTACAAELGMRLCDNGVAVFAAAQGATRSHQLALTPDGMDGHAAAILLSRANMLTSAIGLPVGSASTPPQGVRLGTPEIARWGMTTGDMAQIAAFLGDALLGRRELPAVAADVECFRRQFSKLHFIR